MPPLQSSSPQRRFVVPQPSQSMLAMQEKGLELTSPRRRVVSSSKIGQSGNMNATARQSLPVSPSDSSYTKTSSIYTTASLESTSSMDSAETTISNIIEMYTDLANKVPVETSTPDFEIVQPKAYRDTIAPLLRRQFSNTSEVSLPSILQSPELAKNSDPLSNPSNKQAVDFQEFSRNLKEKRFELVSPMTISSFKHPHQSFLDETSEASPTSTQSRPFSYGSKEGVGNHSIDDRAVSPLHASEISVQLSSKFSSYNLKLHHNALTQSNLSGVPLQSKETLRYIESQHSYDGQRNPSPTQLTHQEGQVLQDNNAQSYPPRSSRFYSAGTTIVHNGISESVKSLLRERSNRKKDAQDTANIMATAARKYPAMKGDQEHPSLLSKEGQRSSLINGADNIIRRMSIPTTTAHSNPMPAQPRRRAKPAAIPLTPYQKYGAEIWSPKKKKGRGDRKMDQEASQMNSSSQRRPSSFESYRPGHQRTPSSRTADAIDTKPFHGVKNGFFSTLGGVKNSLTHTPAEKRREKLKESIVVIGPTQLSIANVSSAAGS